MGMSLRQTYLLHRLFCTGKAYLWHYPFGLTKPLNAYHSFSSSADEPSPSDPKSTQDEKEKNNGRIFVPAALSRRIPHFRGIYKAMIGGEVGQLPLQIVRRNGSIVTIFTVGTSGLFKQSVPPEFSSDSREEAVDKTRQWHKITIHDESLGRIAMEKLKKGMKVYIEGELETRVYNDTKAGIVKRDREISVRGNGSVTVVADNGSFPLNLYTG